ncbi:hypothetical protein AAHE18_05G139100 [Arachis hypogaea]|nr:uncharacterized protein LOC112801476 isoform X1 [Arachis hypogaea]XP_025700010.1 uncharacterized protein LOC112801476 isoform X1 [Arachis hypogaea]XP_025700011.1 uncharacterized protein LOC112801476 isoform X1 [Arachis hypogaea]QHO41992.1 Putative pre-16S rRNA nuclease [Arachis hypogaea]
MEPLFLVQSCSTVQSQAATAHHPPYRNASRALISQPFKFQQVKAVQLFHDLVNKNEPARLLGLDVGDKYVGLALSDFQNKIASPFSVLVRKKSNIDLMASDFETLISKYSLKGFVVGLPFSCHRVSTDAAQVKVLIDALSRTKKLQGLKYTYWNESFTSKNVELLLRPLNLNNAVHSKTMLDKFAAVGILQGYLDYVNRKMKLMETE